MFFFFFFTQECIKKQKMHSICLHIRNKLLNIIACKTSLHLIFIFSRKFYFFFLKFDNINFRFFPYCIYNLLYIIYHLYQMNLNDEPIGTRAIKLPICMTASRHQKIVHNNATIIFSSSGKFLFACVNTCTYSYLLS